MKYLITIGILFLLFLTNGCVQQTPYLENVKLQKDTIFYNEKMIIDFTIVNNGETSFEPQVKILGIESSGYFNCFMGPTSKDLSVIISNKKLIDSIEVLPQNNINCKNSEFNFYLALYDKSSGNKITEKSLTIYIKN